MWFVYALLSALTAALVAIFAKVGLREVEPTLATTLRSIIMAGFLVVLSLGLGKFAGHALHRVDGKAWLMIAASGIAGAVSWLFYFLALRDGPASAVAALDRLSLVFVVVLAALFLAEALTWRIACGAALMVAGALLISTRSGDVARWWAAWFS